MILETEDSKPASEFPVAFDSRFFYELIASGKTNGRHF